MKMSESKLDEINEYLTENANIILNRVERRFDIQVDTLQVDDAGLVNIEDIDVYADSNYVCSLMGLLDFQKHLTYLSLAVENATGLYPWNEHIRTEVTK